jgi:glutathione S-transferase
MAQYRLYCTKGSGNSYKVALYLNCAGLDWEPVGVNLAGGVTRDSGWRTAMNEMGEVPVLEVADKRMSQSGAILTWLVETTGHFAVDADNRFEALRWLFFDNHRFTNDYAVHRRQHCFTPAPAHESVMVFLRARVEASFAIVEKHLSGRRFMLGDRLTIVDFSMAGYVFYPPEETGFDIALDYPAIDAWRKRIAALPGWKLPYEMMPIGGSPPMRAVAPDPR